jgi:DNA-binding MarR family transcriptional regulator
MCMGMCSEMLNAIRQTTALAVHATPELEEAFGEWLKQLERRAMELIAQGPQDASELAKALNITKASANYLLARLAQSGTITLAVGKKL